MKGAGEDNPPPLQLLRIRVNTRRVVDVGEMPDGSPRRFKGSLPRAIARDFPAQMPVFVPKLRL